MKLPEATCLTVPKELGEKAIQLVTKLKLFNNKLQIQQIDDSLCIPLISKPESIILDVLGKKLVTFKISKHKFAERKKKHIIPTDLFKKKLPSDLLSNVPRAIDFIGDIAIVEIPKELKDYKNDIGEAILTAHKQTNTVFAKSGEIKGVFRTRDLELIAGEDKTKTIYKEYGCTYHVDVSKAYFSPRLANEHNRVASQVENGETVIDLFAGVGPFSIPIAKKHKKILVYAIDINPDAILLLKQNIQLNSAEKKIIAIHGDSRQIVKKQFFEKADRVIMNLPEKSIDFIGTACKAIKMTGGILHYYCFVKDSKPLEKAKVQLKKAVNQNEKQIQDFICTKTVREVAPYTWQIVVDARIQ